MSDQCKQCGRNWNPKWRNSDGFCWSCYDRKRKLRYQDKIHQVVGTECWFCGYTKGPDVKRVFDFHHIDPALKEFPLCITSLFYSWERILTELQKCCLVCANCHRLIDSKHITASEVERIYRTRWTEIKASDRWHDLKKPETRQNRVLQARLCEECGKQYDPKRSSQRFCSFECSSKGKRKVKRPSLAELQDLVKRSSMEAVGRKYDVSGVTIKKWLRAA